MTPICDSIRALFARAPWQPDAIRARRNLGPIPAGSVLRWSDTDQAYTAPGCDAVVLAVQARDGNRYEAAQ